MSMNRRRFLTAPLIALGAGACAGFGAVVHAKAGAERPLRFALLRLEGSDGSAADAQLRGNAWEKVVDDGGLSLARITVHAFVPAVLLAPQSVLVQTVYGGAGEATATHDLYRYFAAKYIANGKAVGFDAVEDAFLGFRLSLSRAEGEAVQVGEFRMPRLRPGLYALLSDDVVLPMKYTFTGELARPLAGVFGLAPNHLAFSVAESV
jgi:hypothetical protein